MKYKKKKLQKTKQTIPTSLISNNRFTEIASLLGKKESLSNQERYLYGYALLREENIVETLVVWWPLAVKKRGQLEQDCAKLATIFFAKTNNCAEIAVTDEQLLTLFYIARTLYPNSRVYATLKRSLWIHLFEKGDYEKLEKLIKSEKGAYSSAVVENLSKVNYFQTEKKFTREPRAVVSYVITGAACLLMRERIYWDDMDTCIKLLAQKLKSSYAESQHKNNSTWSCDLLNKFVDYEASIVISVLALVKKTQVTPFDVIPSPSYLMTYDPQGSKLGTAFLTWLTASDSSLAALYQTKIYLATFWAMTGKQLLASNHSVMTIDDSNLPSPYLKFAIMLRATTNPTSSPTITVSDEDFTTAQHENAFYREVAIKTVQDVLSRKENLTKELNCLSTVLYFYKFISCDELNHLLTRLTLDGLKSAYQLNLNLDVKLLKSFAKEIKDIALQEQANKLIERDKNCLAFIESLHKNASKKIIQGIKTLDDLNSHLRLIADSCYLRYEDLDLVMYEHMEKLASNKKINQLYPLEKTLNFSFGCACDECANELYRRKIVSLCGKLTLSTVAIPAINSQDRLGENKDLLKLITLNKQELNPFTTLGVKVSDSKKTIMENVLKLIGEAPQQMATFRHAQTMLFNPATRFTAHYFYAMAEMNTDDTEMTAVVDASSSNVKTIPLRQEYY